MTYRARIGWSLLASVAVWMIATWPLPRHIADGVPMSHSGGRDQPVRVMVPGDHLQLMYYHWLLADMLAGQTPWMTNPYEFHTGDAAARYKPDPYYIPFSLIYAATAPLGGRAFGYNMAGLVSIWITYLFTWLLVRRYTRDEKIAAATALVAILLPYRWFALLGGSPTGFAMALTPLLMWGLDRAVRDTSVAGGVWAGVAILFSFTSDLHIFFFNTLLTPAWCVIAFAARPDFGWREPKAWLRLAGAVAPAAVMLVAIVWHSKSGAVDLSETHMAGGRALREVALFSPRADGFLGWAEHPVSSQVYLGYVLLAILAAGAVGVMMRWVRGAKDAGRDALVYGLLLAGVGAIAILALGPHGLRGGRLFVIAREVIPNYEMIRQAGKVFGILPPILAVLCGMALAALRPAAGNGVGARLLVAVPVVLLAAEYLRRSHPPVCLLDREQPAYRAVVDDANLRGVTPHMLVVPLWPGDTHYASLYQYYASLYRIRMVNGYTPAIDQAYFDDIFLRYQTINQGWFSDDQADSLLARGIGYVVLHEDLFPEKVSPFPVTYTLKTLLEHPRLELLEQSGPVWSFRIRDEAGPPGRAPSSWTVFFPARYHELTRGIGRDDPRFLSDDTADRGGTVRLTGPGPALRVPGTGCPPAPGARWLVRARGDGRFNLNVFDTDTGESITDLEVAPATSDWAWFEAPVMLDVFRNISLELAWRSGSVDLDVALLVAGDWTLPEPGDEITLPASLFFHAGHIDLDRDAVRFSRERDEARIVFYGPRLPLPAGDYDITLHHTSGGRDGEVVGQVYLKTGMFDDDVIVPVMAGEPVTVAYHHRVNLPVTVIFVYARTADVALERVVIQRTR